MAPAKGETPHAHQSLHHWLHLPVGEEGFHVFLQPGNAFLRPDVGSQGIFQHGAVGRVARG